MHIRRSGIAGCCTAALVLAAACRNNETTKGQVTEAKGRVEQAAGDITGDRQLKADGKRDQLKGKAQQAVGKVEHAVNP